MVQFKLKRPSLLSLIVFSVLAVCAIGGWEFASPITNFKTRVNGTATTAAAAVDFSGDPDPYRKGITIMNTSDATIYLGYGEAPSASPLHCDYALGAGASIAVEMNQYQSLYVIVAASTKTYSAKEYRY